MTTSLRAFALVLRKLSLAIIMSPNKNESDRPVRNSHDKMRDAAHRAAKCVGPKRIH
jgi:hypothetical protein